MGPHCVSGWTALNLSDVPAGAGPLVCWSRAFRGRRELRVSDSSHRRTNPGRRIAPGVRPCLLHLKPVRPRSRYSGGIDRGHRRSGWSCRSDGWAGRGPSGWQLPLPSLPSSIISGERRNGPKNGRRRSFACRRNRVSRPGPGWEPCSGAGTLPLQGLMGRVHCAAPVGRRTKVDAGSVPAASTTVRGFTGLSGRANQCDSGP